MDVLVVLGSTGHVGEIATGGVLRTLGVAGRAARVHEEEGSLRRHRGRRHHGALILADDIVDEDVAALHHRGLRRVLAGMAPEDQHLVDLLAERRGPGHGLVGLDLVIDQVAVPVVAVDGDQEPALGVGDPLPAGGAAEAAKDLGVNDPEAGAGQHRHRKLGNHGHVKGYPVARLEAAEVAEQGGELVDPAVQLTVGDGLGQLTLGLGHPDQCRLIGPRLEMPVDTVVAGVEPATDKPFPEGRLTAVQGGVPVPVPAQQVGVLAKALREVLLPKAVQDRRIVRVGLADEARRRLDVLLLSPVHRNLGFRYLELFPNGHESSSAVAVIGETRRAGPVRSPESILKRAPSAVKQERPARTLGWALAPSSHHGSHPQARRCRRVEAPRRLSGGRSPR